MALIFCRPSGGLDSFKCASRLKLCFTSLSCFGHHKGSSSAYKLGHLTCVQHKKRVGGAGRINTKFSRKINK